MLAELNCFPINAIEEWVFANVFSIILLRIIRPGNSIPIIVEPTDSFRWVTLKKHPKE